jgi:hypothetical protein
MQKAQGWVEKGNTIVALGGLSSTTKVQGSFPLATVTVYIHTPISLNISNIVRNGNIVTVTMPAGYGFAQGQSVNITGVTDSSFDGTFIITSVAPTTFTFAQFGGDTASGGGTATSLGLATLYSDDVGTPKANPFTASVDGTWFFYVPNGNYDVNFSGLGIASPFTIGDLRAFDPTPLWLDVTAAPFFTPTDGITDATPALKAVAAAVVANGGTVFFPSSHNEKYLVKDTVVWSSLKPITLLSEMAGDTFTTDGPAIVLGADISGPIFRFQAQPIYLPDRGTNGGKVQGLCFMDVLNRFYTCTAALDLHDFTESTVSNCNFHFIKGCAINCDFVVKSQITDFVITECGDVGKPALWLNPTGGNGACESIGIHGGRMEVNHLAPYIQAELTGVSTNNISDIRFEAETITEPDSNQLFIYLKGDYVNVWGCQFNRNTGTVIQIDGRNNSICSSCFQTGAFSTTSIVVNGGVNIISNNTFGTTRTGREIDFMNSGGCVFSGNVGYFSGQIYMGGSGSTSNICQGNAWNSATVASGFWIDGGLGFFHLISNNTLNNNNGPVTTVGGIKTGANNVITGNSVADFYNTGNGKIGIKVSSSGNTIDNNRLDYAPFSVDVYDQSWGDNYISNVPDPVFIPLYVEATWDPPSVPAVGMAGNSVKTTISVTGSAVGDFVELATNLQSDGLIFYAYAALDTVVVLLTNTTIFPVDLGSLTLFIKVRKKWN